MDTLGMVETVSRSFVSTRHSNTVAALRAHLHLGVTPLKSLTMLAPSISATPAMDFALRSATVTYS
jgi:hypothetical protein